MERLESDVNTVGTCGHQLSTEKLPNTVQQQTCDRPIWDESDDGRCILHTGEPVEATEALETAIADASRIDGLQFGRQTLPEGFKFEDMVLFGADFQNADLTQCEFRNTKICDARFEGATLTGAYFGPDEDQDDDEDSDGNRGVVHTRTNVKSNNFGGANLSEATFREVDLMDSGFDCDSLRSVSFIDCSLSEVKFIDQELRDSDFSYSILRKTAFDSCDLHNATFHAAKLEQTRFASSILQNADLRNAILDKTEFDDIQINHRTQFDSYLVQEYLADRYSEGEFNADEIKDPKQYLHTKRDQIPIPFDEKLTAGGLRQSLRHGLTRLIARRPGQEGEPDYDHLEHARYRYRDLSRVFSSNGEPERAREYSIREKHAKRKNALRNHESSWLWLSMTRWAMKYGEEPTQPLKVAGAIIIISALVYPLPLFGVLQEESGQLIQYCLDCDPSAGAIVRYVISIGHLSIVRLFTPTNPDIRPTGLGVLVGLFQSISGALLTAMFVFTLGRRATE